MGPEWRFELIIIEVLVQIDYDKPLVVKSCLLPSPHTHHTLTLTHRLAFLFGGRGVLLAFSWGLHVCWRKCGQLTGNRWLLFSPHP